MNANTYCCQHCGDPLPEQDGAGRRRQYGPSPKACKQAAYRARIATKPSHLAEEVRHTAFRNTISALRNEGQLSGKIKPILKYPGAKWRLSRWIVSHFPPHHHYLEPYAGSAACFFVKDPVVHEVLNDLNGGLVQFFRVIQKHGTELAKRIKMTPWSEEEYHSCDLHYQEAPVTRSRTRVGFS